VTRDEHAASSSCPAKNHNQGLELPAYVLAALTAAGGTIGYVRTKSKPSVIAGTAVGLLCKSSS
jgi:uncharacterized membrane protein (UPF0136 family)